MVDRLEISESQERKTFSRRAFVIGAAQASLLCVLGGRLAWLQVSQGERYKTLSDQNRIDTNLILPERGEIFDRYGVPLAVNKQNFRVLVIPEQAKDTESVVRSVKSLLNLSEDYIRDVLKEAGRTAKFIPVEITDNLSWQDVAKIEVHLPDLPGVSIDENKRRTYPFSEATAHLVGYVGAVSQADLDRDDNPLLRQPGFKVGKTGLEKQFENQLRGKSGTEHVEVNVIGREVRKLKNQESTHGERLNLTIDAQLQRFTQERLGQERSATAVVMDAHTGEVFALASSPAFDPNQFTSRLSAAVWEELLASIEHPLNNKAIAGQYPPGSTFKMITALAALEAGVMKPKSTAYCSGTYEYGADLFHCWKRSGHGWVDVIAALEQSCDTYFYKLATELGIDKIAEMARRFGLGETYDFELPGERGGLIPDKKWKLAKFGQRWQPGETIVASIGQGYVQSTPLQLAVMTSRLINGGYAVEPWIVMNEKNKKRRSSRKSWPKMNVNEKHMGLIKEGMDRAVSTEDGTAVASQIKIGGFEMGGKTGTSQVQRITMEQRRAGVRNEDLSWKQRHHALFVGYAPYDKPRYTCSVVVEHGIGGSRTAAPLARDLLLEVQKRAPSQSKQGGGAS